MNLLLLLSALLSALTGVGASARGQDRAQAVAEGSIAAPRAVVAARRIALRPENAQASLSQMAARGIETGFSLIAAEPAFATRRRE